MHELTLMPYVLALLSGVVAGMRSMTAPAMVSWAARLGKLHLGATWLAFFGSPWTLGILTLGALGELFGDKLPATPSRKAPGPFAFRIVSGAVCGAAIGTVGSAMAGGAIAGAAGAVIGTLGGFAFRAKLASAFGSDRPAAFIEDGVAILGAVLIGVAL